MLLHNILIHFHGVFKKVMNSLKFWKYCIRLPGLVSHAIFSSQNLSILRELWNQSYESKWMSHGDSKYWDETQQLVTFWKFSSFLDLSYAPNCRGERVKSPRARVEAYCQGRGGGTRKDNPDTSSWCRTPAIILLCMRPLVSLSIQIRFVF